MTEICQLMQRCMGNTTSRWLLSLPPRDPIFQSSSFELQLVPGIWDGVPNLSHSHVARRLCGTLFPATPSTMQGSSPGAQSQHLSNGMNAPNEGHLQNQRCSGHPVLQHGVCCAAEDAAPWGSHLPVRKGESGDRKFKIRVGMAICGGHGISGRLG